MTREEIIRNLKYTMEKHKNDRVDTFDTNISAMCKDILDYLEQEPKTGHWIDFDGNPVELEDGIPKDSCYCSICDKWLVASDEYACYGNYCPNCGAKMVEPQESEDKSEQYSICEKCDYDYDPHSGECYDCVKAESEE